ncbi:hypothetical protein [Streptomyces clavuligerus]|uniref:Putative plasmid transfer protein TraB n=1 Tax=Streptomyces clavuligerus TaxID=1901 RepID=B5GRU9_STRCL|nr:hypothetical protein [Streptomyces clavuligerus]EDY49045.1 conserved hypothetical protein [Streptomyces clavuligerus]EDY50036.1 conserved hypothetical protein [Streptomyces clavuligerus]EFG03745.1 Putative plasmid transfer protein TraB [Streptomyces clavuligerus]MBY6307716.1 plasmid transfer protein [Streptomyces clavuligerus]QCS09734.1 plasmid transfer protein [Streptomyces clavuligerus]
MDMDLECSVPYPIASAGASPYQAFQQALRNVDRELSTMADDLAVVERAMRRDAQAVEGTAEAIARAGLDDRFVRMTQEVAILLGGTARGLGLFQQAAQEAADDTAATARLHTSLYGRLDEIRSGRKEKTPKPGFFTD